LDGESLRRSTRPVTTFSRSRRFEPETLCAMRLPRILLADDHALIVEGLRNLLQPHFDIVGVCLNGRDLLEQASRLKPAVIVLDVCMPGLNGMEAGRRLKTLAPESKLVFVTQQTSREYAYAALQLGAFGFVSKQSAISDVVDAVRAALNGSFFVSPELRGGTSDGAFRASMHNPLECFAERLTPRQREVLQLVAEGRSIKEIAYELHISIKTVDFHKAGLMDCLKMRTTAELTRYAIQQGIVNT
jgi:DNA-binding NarL/FixJ family response regulator